MGAALEPFAVHISSCQYWAVPHYSWSSIAHYLFNFFAHGRFITMYRTLRAYGFVIPINTFIHPLLGIGEKLTTLRAQLLVRTAMFSLTIKRDHLLYSI